MLSLFKECADEVVTDCVRDSGSAVGTVHHSANSSSVYVWRCFEGNMAKVERLWLKVEG